MYTNLISDLHDDMAQAIDEVDRLIFFVAGNASSKELRDKVVIDLQKEIVSSIEDGKHLKKAKFSVDPIPGWKNRLRGLKADKNPHSALKRYCDFMRQTEEIRFSIEDFEDEIDSLIQEQIDIDREK